CADITFSSTAKPGPCTNGTNVKAVPYTGKATNANGTSSGDQTAGTTTPSGTGTAAGSKPTKGGAGGSLSMDMMGLGLELLVGGVVTALMF
ncbi:MAG: hypothetical protein Q9191_006821, partial [Dirinaria sp. TL-2023a]